MANARSAADRYPDLREFIKENDQRVYDFCSYLVGFDYPVEDLVLEIFREFGEYYRRGRILAGKTLQAEPLRIRLFQIAWAHIQRALQRAVYSVFGGRDTRAFKGLDEDILGRAEGQKPSAADGRIRDRLSRVDVELRAPVVLRDVLQLEDEQVARILGLRWGVYRHRLHRGRLDFKDALRGAPPSASPPREGSAAW